MSEPGFVGPFERIYVFDSATTFLPAAMRRIWPTVGARRASKSIAEQKVHSDASVRGTIPLRPCGTGIHHGV